MNRLPLALAGSAPIAHLDDFGYVHFADGSRVEWWVLGDDHWHVPLASPSLRQRSIDHSPVVETTIRVPGGDVAWRAAAVATPDGAVVAVECENLGRIPVAVALARVDRDGHVTVEVAPVTHSSTWRGAIGDADATTLPTLDAVARGWLALAAQGAQITTHDPSIDEILIAARASLLLHHGALIADGKRADKSTAAAIASALTLLGCEDEAGELRRATRNKPSRRGLPLVATIDGHSITPDELAVLRDPLRAAQTVMAIRTLLVSDAPRNEIDCLPGSDETWRGRPVDIADLPTNHGTISYAVRWHGEKPALLWETNGNATVRATALDPNWSSREPAGEELLGVISSARSATL